MPSVSTTASALFNRMFESPSVHSQADDDTSSTKSPQAENAGDEKQTDDVEDGEQSYWSKQAEDFQSKHEYGPEVD